MILAGSMSMLSGTQCKAESGKRIVVSIDDQVAYFLEDGFFVRSHIVSTGTDATPTPVGTFHIYRHEYSYDNGSSSVQFYTMYYYGHLGFHSVLYHPSDGSWTGSELGQKASHGCIRQRLDDARWAYYWTPDGTEADMIQQHFTPPPPKPKPAEGGGDAAGTVRPSKTWYFAEGCTADGFDEFLSVMNPQADPANATITFMASDGSRIDTKLTIPPHSRRTIHANTILGGKQGLSAAIASDRSIVAERSMYYQYGNGALGGDMTSGSTSPAKEWYFAEGTCRPGFDSYLCIENPGVGTADVRIDYALGNGAASAQKVTVKPLSRLTINVKDHLGGGDDAAHDFSCIVKCTNGRSIIAERPQYFNYGGVWDGGHNVVGLNAPAPAFYFAEGTCRPGFEPYLCIFNPQSHSAKVKITFMLGNGKQVSGYLRVGGRSRFTARVKDYLGEGDDDAHDFSCEVRSVDGSAIVVERPMYFDYHGPGTLNWAGGHDIMGVTALASDWYFAEGTCRPRFEPYLCIFNPGDGAAGVTITYMLGNGSVVRKDLKVAARSRATVHVKDHLGEGDDTAHDFSCVVHSTSPGGIMVERPIYFSYKRY